MAEASPKIDKASDKQTDKQPDKPTDKPADKHTNKPTDKQTDKSTDKPTDKPPDKQTDKPADKHTDKPTDKSTKPASPNKSKSSRKSTTDNKEKKVKERQEIAEVPTPAESLAELSNLLKAAGKKPVIVDVHASWCGPCLTLRPKFHELAEKYRDKILSVSIDVDSAQDVVDEYSVTHLPTVIVCLEGKVVYQKCDSSWEHMEELFAQFTAGDGSTAKRKSATTVRPPAPLTADDGN